MAVSSEQLSKATARTIIIWLRDKKTIQYLPSISERTIVNVENRLYNFKTNLRCGIFYDLY